jgi:hypothetical protein
VVRALAPAPQAPQPLAPGEHRLHKLLDDLWELAPTPRRVVSKADGQVAMGRRQKRADSHNPARQRRVNRETVEEAVILTW